ncbi:MAG: M50 family metallopeptidase [Polyangiaceae bacterium]
MKEETPPPRPTSRGALLFAVVLSVVVGSFVPFGRYLLYPFTLMATWVHEMGHGIGALVSGGRFESLDVFGDASGLAHVANTDAADGLVCAAGLLGPPIAGAAILAFARGPRRARLLLAVVAGAMVVSLAVWVRSIAGWVSLPITAALIGVFARWGSPREILVFAQFLGLRLALDTVTRIDYIFTDKVEVGGVTRLSDIARVAQCWGGPRFFWSLVIAGLSLLFVAAGGWAAIREGKQPAPAPKRAR